MSLVLSILNQKQISMDYLTTVTFNRIDIKGFYMSLFRFSKLHTSADTLNTLQNSEGLTNSKTLSILYAMTTCHSLKLVNGKLIGDPLDLKMFEFTHWILEETGQGSSYPTGSAGPSLSEIAGNIVPTVVRSPGSRMSDLSDLLAADGLNGKVKVSSRSEFCTKCTWLLNDIISMTYSQRLSLNLALSVLLSLCLL